MRVVVKTIKERLPIIFMDLFSFQHLCWIIGALLFSALCIAIRRLGKETKWHTVLRWTLFSIVFVNEVWWFLFSLWCLDYPFQYNLPLHLCDFSIIVLLIGLATRRRIFCDLAYFVGVPGAALAILFPDIAEVGGIQSIAIARFFVTHIALFGIGFYLTFGIRYYPSYWRAIISFVVIHLYALLLTPVNLWLDTNYFFLRSPAASAPAFLQAFPHWAYIGAFMLFFFVVISLLWIPFGVISRRNG